ncbi:MAG: hypothetical protein ABJC04_06830, partial [Verrucomicrobiota bacterium]
VNVSIAPTALCRDAATNSPIVNRKSKKNIADFYQLSIRETLNFVDELSSRRKISKAFDPLTLALNEVRSRLNFLNEVGLGYLTLDRPTKTLSGGETERVNLTTCLGSRLVNTLFVLDEPSVGLHARDTDRLIEILQSLRDAGNTVVVVEHESSVMRAADQIVDLGPGHGESGGDLVFQGTYREILKSKNSLTGKYLSGRKKIEIRERRTVNVGQTSRLPILPLDRMGRRDACPTLMLAGANTHNLKNVSVEIPLSRFVCITGVSGSGKTTLMRDVLLPALTEKLQAKRGNENPEDGSQESESNEGEPDSQSNSAFRSHRSACLSGSENLSRVVLVDQSALGKTPRSNPAVYIGAFDDIRELFAQTEVAKQRGLNASAFSFNSAQGQCEKCRGAGFEKIEMQFLSDIFIRCPECQGRRYRPHILEIKLRSSRGDEALIKSFRVSQSLVTSSPTIAGRSIADVLDASVDEAIAFLENFSDSRHAIRAVEKIKLLQEVGLGYLRLGQPINTLSGGESQRLKLVSNLAESGAGVPPASSDVGSNQKKSIVFAEGRRADCPTLFLFDEPTTGLHFDDVRVLLKVFQRLVDGGHSVVVIEHNLDVMRSADWLIDLGPGAGADGGRVIFCGTPEQIIGCPESSTGVALQKNFS